jgi:hypothetical protein
MLWFLSFKDQNMTMTHQSHHTGHSFLIISNVATQPHSAPIQNKYSILSSPGAHSHEVNLHTALKSDWDQWGIKKWFWALVFYKNRRAVLSIALARARICKCLWSPGINSEESIPPAYVAWARICKPFKEPRNRFRRIPQNRFLGSLNVHKYGLRMYCC